MSNSPKYTNILENLMSPRLNNSQGNKQNNTIKSMNRVQQYTGVNISTGISICTSTCSSTCTSTCIPRNKPIDQNHLTFPPFEDTKEIKTDQSVSVHHPFSERDLLIQACRASITQGLAVSRPFRSSVLMQGQHITPSTCTYWGMLEIFNKIKKDVGKLGLHDVCVLCPRYALTSNPKWPGGDTQAGGTGRATKWYDPKYRKMMYESFQVAAQEELKEELRITSTNLSLASIFNVTKQKNNYVEHAEYQVYTTRVSDCSPVPNYDPIEYGKKKRRGKDNNSARVGFIPWGTLDECIDIVTMLQSCSKPDKLVDSIDAISIVSLDKAIEMVLFANSHLVGQIVKKQIF